MRICVGSSAKHGNAASGLARRSSSRHRAERPSVPYRRALHRGQEAVQEHFPGQRGDYPLRPSAGLYSFLNYAKYDFTRTDVDAKGVAYQELVGVNLRGDRGQYFTPRGVVKLVVEMLDPKESETLLDPACGTGGFLVAIPGAHAEEIPRGAEYPGR